MTDLCCSRFCQDIALPGRDYCAGCETDQQAERERIADEARRLTAQHEAELETVA